MKCSGVLVRYECIEDDEDWGKKGSTNSIFFPEEMYSYHIAKSYAPSNWKITFLNDADRNEKGGITWGPGLRVERDG